ncbi:MAG: hypothetical protein KKD11_02125 [Candidatus Omnitrophica bacterium]|nr:hypothetical protein [Candidatus Omnitrophota bacterium]
MMSEKEILRKLKDLRSQYTLFELGKKLDVNPNQIWRWLKEGKISKSMAQLLGYKIREQGL